MTFGDVVNTRRPGNFKIRRKTDDVVVKTQDAKLTNVQVPLDQHFFTAERPWDVQPVFLGW